MLQMMMHDGTDGANVISIDQYETIWKHFCNFCFLTGDYKSAMLPDHDLCPANPFLLTDLQLKCTLTFAVRSL